MIPQLVVSGLALGSIYALLALSLVLINKATDVVNFAQGEMAMFGTFICFALLTKVGFPLATVLVLAVPIGALLGVVAERVTIVAPRPADSSASPPTDKECRPEMPERERPSQFQGQCRCERTVLKSTP